MLIVGALVPAVGQARDSSDGCGLGWEVTQDKTLMATLTRGTTNNFVPPTFGMTTGTIGCEQHSIAQNDQGAAVYAMVNHEALLMEMASGSGEVLDAFARSMGCSDAALNDFASLTQGHFADLQGHSNGIEMFVKARSLVNNHPALSASCSSI